MKAPVINITDQAERCSAEIALAKIEARIGEIRAEIEAGTYVTPERIDGAVERILEILRGDGMPFHRQRTNEQRSSGERFKPGTKDVC